MPTELTVEEIQTTVNKFVECANRAVKAGFDGVEIHMAHGYLVNQFFSRNPMYEPMITVETQSDVHDLPEKLSKALENSHPKSIL